MSIPHDASPARRGSRLDAVEERVYGYDYFISYCREDGSAYAAALEAGLAKAGFICFFDRKGNPPGEEVTTRRLRAKLERSSALILVGSPKAVESDFVLSELTIFSELGRRIVPIDIGRTLRDLQTTHRLQHVLAGLLVAVAWTDETAERLEKGPSEAVLEDLVRSFEYRRETGKRLRLLSATVAVLGLLLAGALVAGGLAEWQRRVAVEQRDQATARRLSLEASAVDRDLPQLRLLLAAAAVQQTRRGAEGLAPAENALREALRRLRGTSLWRREEPSSACSFSEDGRRLAIGTGTGRVEIRDAASGHFILPGAPAHEGGVAAIVFAGKDVYSAGQDGKVLRFGEDGAPVPVLHLEGSQDRLLTALAVDPNEGWLAVGDFSGRVRWRRLDASPSDEEALPAAAHTAWVQALAFPGGDRLVSAAKDGRVLLWSLRRPELPPRELAVHTNGASALAIDRARRFLVTGGDDGRLDLVDLATLDVAVLPPGLPAVGMVHALSFDRDGKRLAVGGDARIAVLSFDGGAPRVLAGHEKGVIGFHFTPDGGRLVSASRDGEIREWDLAAEPADAEPAVLPGLAGSATVLPDGKGERVVINRADPNGMLTELIHAGLARRPGCGLVAPFVRAASADGRSVLIEDATSSTQGICSWTDGGLQPLPSPNLGLPQELRAAALDGDSGWVALGDAGGNLAVWPSRTPGAPPLRLPKHRWQIVELRVADGRLISLSRDALRLWPPWEELAKGEPLRLALEKTRASALTPDGRLLAAVGEDGDTVLWNLRTDPPQELLRHRQADSHNSLYAVALSADGRWLAAGGIAATVSLWDRRAGNRPPLQLEQPGGAILSLAFSPDGRWLATSSSSDDTFRVWDLASPAPALEPRLFSGHGQSVAAVAWAGRKRLVSVGATGQAVLWRLELDELLALAKARAPRDFSQPEWDRYFPGSSVRTPQSAYVAPVSGGSWLDFFLRPWVSFG